MQFPVRNKTTKENDYGISLKDGKYRVPVHTENHVLRFESDLGIEPKI